MATDASEELSRLRSESGLSREKVAAVVGYSAKSIERWEKGDPIDVNKLKRIRTFYEDFAATRPRLYNDGPTIAESLAPYVATAPPGPRFPVANLLRLPDVRARLSAIQTELIERGATPEYEENVMRTLRDRTFLSRFVDGVNDEYTEAELIEAINNIAESALRFLEGPTL